MTNNKKINSNKANAVKIITVITKLTCWFTDMTGTWDSKWATNSEFVAVVGQLARVMEILLVKLNNKAGGSVKTTTNKDQVDVNYKGDKVEHRALSVLVKRRLEVKKLRQFATDSKYDKMVFASIAHAWESCKHGVLERDVAFNTLWWNRKNVGYIPSMGITPLRPNANKLMSALLYLSYDGNTLAIKRLMAIGDKEIVMTDLPPQLQENAIGFNIATKLNDLKDLYIKSDGNFKIPSLA